jgi:hypothetical protein
MIPEQQDMEIESDDKTSIQVPTNTYEQSTPYNYDDPPSPDQPAFKSACVEPPSSLSVFSPNAQQVETAVLEIELVAPSIGEITASGPAWQFQGSHSPGQSVTFGWDEDAAVIVRDDDAVGET